MIIVVMVMKLVMLYKIIKTKFANFFSLSFFFLLVVFIVQFSVGFCLLFIVYCCCCSLMHLKFSLHLRDVPSFWLDHRTFACHGLVNVASTFVVVVVIVVDVGGMQPHFRTKHKTFVVSFQFLFFFLVFGFFKFYFEFSAELRAQFETFCIILADFLFKLKLKNFSN